MLKKTPLIILMIVLTIVSVKSSSLDPIITGTVGDYINITTSGSSSCLFSCASYISITKLRNFSLANANLTWSYTFDRNGQEYNSSLLSTHDFASKLNVAFSTSIVTGQNCFNETIDNTTSTSCTDIEIPLTKANLISQLQNIGDTAVIKLTGSKARTDTVEWSVVINTSVGSYTIDPLWQGVWGSYLPLSTSVVGTVLSNTSANIAECGIPQQDLININNVSLWKQASVGAIPFYTVTVEGRTASGTPNGTILAQNLSNFNQTNGHQYLVLDKVINITSGTGICLRIQYQSGTINTTRDVSIGYHRPTNTSFFLEDKQVFDNANASMEMFTSNDNGTTWVKQNNAQPTFLLGNTLLATQNFSFGNGYIGTGTANRIINYTKVTVQNFSIESAINPGNTVNITSVSLRIYRTTPVAGPGKCNATIYIINQSILTNAALNNTLGSCALSTNITATTNEEACTFATPITVNTNQAYNIYPLHDDNTSCALSTTTLNTVVVDGSRFQTWGGKDYSAYITTDNFTTTNVLFNTDDMDFYFNIVNNAASGGGTNSSCGGYTGSGNYVLQCNCVLDTNQDILRNNVTTNGSGTINITAAITNITKFTNNAANCEIWLNQSNSKIGAY